MTGPIQIDIPGSHRRNAAMLAVTGGFVAICLYLLFMRPGVGGPRSPEPGGFTEFAALFGIVFFGLYSAILARELIRLGAVISVGRHGIFDRRLSTGWIPWTAIYDVRIVHRKGQRWLLLRTDQDREAHLPFRTGARRVAERNAAGGPYGFWVEAESLKGGFDALHSAVARFHKVIGTLREP
ncbi:hypothetical protein OPKNFCMD_1087 [Methylobacterium crusticola]|uniref:PH domain-containing protein n=1 Tax=Methylobacterium crusticola TaxID=1697972 RepID=A0ABQ4QTU1_9HYPH|nr:hypothetical protein [Methylobacterium crusticola]GJD48369.1 hypothetical protein OPKNFCMD_1087 [Methylobacterium crusticola]